MKELFNKLSNVYSFLKEKLFVYQQAAPSDAPKAEPKAPKPKIDLSGQEAQDAMLAQAEEEGAAVVKSLKLDEGENVKNEAKGVVKILEVEKEHPTLKNLEHTLSLAGINREKVQEVVTDALARAGRLYKKEPISAHNYMAELETALNNRRTVNKTVAARRDNMQDLVKSVDNLNAKFFA